PTPTATPTSTPTATPTSTPLVRISVSPVKVVHGAEATFTVSASPVQTHPVTVLYSTQGTAALGTDYTLDGPTGQIIIPAGQGSATVHMHAAALAATGT